MIHHPLLRVNTFKSKFLVTHFESLFFLPGSTYVIFSVDGHVVKTRQDKYRNIHQQRTLRDKSRTEISLKGETKTTNEKAANFGLYA
jgi:hypothetical protein